MLVTKHAAELCALLVNDLHGELPSRILAALFHKGRSTVGQLIALTALTPRHLRHGLGVLIQQNLIYHHTDVDTGVVHYEGNPDACYSLTRFGKILEVIETNYGFPERELVQTLLSLGHTRVGDLVQAFSSRFGQTNGHANGTHDDATADRIMSQQHLHETLARLVQAEIIEPVRPESFRKPADVFHEIREGVEKTAPGEKATKKKDQLHQETSDGYKQYRERSKQLKRQLDQDHGAGGKRRKLENGSRDQRNGHRAIEVNLNVVVRINFERCAVELRNQRLAEYAAETFGEITGVIYRTALDLLTTKLSRCRPDDMAGEEEREKPATTTTMEIFENLDPTLNVQFGIGKAGKDALDFKSAEKLRPDPPASDDESEDDEAPAPRPRVQALGEPDDDDDDDESEDEVHAANTRTNGKPKSKVKFEDDGSVPKSRMDQMRQHLLLLCEGKRHFLRHCGAQGRGQFTVDFDLLMNGLRELEMDRVIEQTHGRHGLRLTRILREKGKLDEKTLPAAALMKKQEVQAKMLAMQMAKRIDVQEVPKDNSRLANRTLFFYFFDRERVEATMLEDVYKAMCRCYQTLEVQRHRNRNVLSFVERKDVQGREEEVMTAEHYNEYNKHLEVEEKLLGQASRLDELVAVFRDY